MFRRLQFSLLVLAPVAIFAAVLVVHRMFDLAGGTYDYVLRIDLPPVDGQVGLPDVSGPPDASRPLVVIDPGHGGHDPGAGRPELFEKDVTLQVARAIRDQLLAQGGIRVALTRDEDKYLLLAERSSIARRLNADLFLSIHADSAENAAASGASVYVLSTKGSSQAAAKFAERENRSDELNGVPMLEANDAVSAILVDLSQRQAQGDASEMARLVLRELDGQARVHRSEVQSAAFGVLKAPDVPSVLFEIGYISNPQDAQFISSREGRQAVARAASQAIRVFFARQTDI